MEIHRAAAAAGARKKQLRDWLRCAETLGGKLLEEFWDPEGGGLFLSSSDDPLLTSFPSRNITPVFFIVSKKRCWFA